MNIKTIQRRKSVIEAKIAKILGKFEKETLCKVQHIMFNSEEKVSLPQTEGERASLIVENKVSITISID